MWICIMVCYIFAVLWCVVDLVGWLVWLHFGFFYIIAKISTGNLILAVFNIL